MHSSLNLSKPRRHRAGMGAVLVAAMVGTPLVVVPEAPAQARPTARAADFVVGATLCEGSCLRAEIIAGSSITLMSVYQRNDGRAQLTETRVLLMEKPKGGAWRPAQAHFLDWNKSDLAGWSPTVYPATTKKYKFVLEPPCYEYGTNKPACQLIDSPVITIVVGKASGKFRWDYVAREIPASRGEACVRGLLEQRATNGKWSVNISSADISVQRRQKGKWLRIDTFRITGYGGFERCLKASPGDILRLVVNRIASKPIRITRN